LGLVIAPQEGAVLGVDMGHRFVTMGSHPSRGKGGFEGFSLHWFEWRF